MLLMLRVTTEFALAVVATSDLIPQVEFLRACLALVVCCKTGTFHVIDRATLKGSDGA